MCPDCVTFGQLIRAWKVSGQFLGALIRSGRLKTHEHGERTTITRESVAECNWTIALAKADLDENEAA